MKKYTLIELLVAMGIFAFMMLLLMNFFSISTDLLGRENNRATKLYEASVISSILQQDLKNLSVNGTDKPFEYHTDRSGKTYLRFFTTGYDENTSVDTTTAIMVSYIYDSSTYEIERYVESVDNFRGADLLSTFYDNTASVQKIANGTKDWTDIEVSTNGALILEGVEAFDILLYPTQGDVIDTITYDGFQNFDALDPQTNSNASFSHLKYSAYSTSDHGITTKPDAITIQLILNDKDAIGVTGLEEKNRRTITQQFLLGYND